MLACRLHDVMPLVKPSALGKYVAVTEKQYTDHLEALYLALHIGVLALRGRKLPSNNICVNCIITPSNIDFTLRGVSPPHFPPACILKIPRKAKRPTRGAVLGAAHSTFSTLRLSSSVVLE